MEDEIKDKEEQKARKEVLKKIDSMAKQTPLLLLSAFRKGDVVINRKNVKLNEEEFKYLEKKCVKVVEDLREKGEYRKLVSIYLKKGLFEKVPSSISNKAFVEIADAFEKHMEKLAKQGNPFALKDILKGQSGYSSLYFLYERSISNEEKEELDSLMYGKIKDIIEKKYLHLYNIAAENYVKMLVEKRRKGKLLSVELQKISAGLGEYSDFPKSAKLLAEKYRAEFLSERFNQRKSIPKSEKKGYQKLKNR